MKKRIFALSSLVLALVLMISIVSCKKSSTTTFALSTLMSGTIDMNGATPPSDVPKDPTIVATFTVSVDPASATSATITMVRDYDQANIDLTITVSGSTITMVPTSGDLGNGAKYILTFNGLMSTDNQSLAAFNRSFTTVGTFVPSGVVAYWNFEGNANDQVGTWNADAEVDVVYQPSYTAVAGQAAFFNGTTSIIEIPNGDQLDNEHDFSLSFWVKTNSVGHVDAGGNPKGHFVIGLGAFKGYQFEVAGDYGSCKLAASYNVGDTAFTTEDLWFNGDGKTGANGGWQGWTFCQDLTGSGGVAAKIKDVWASVVCVYNSSTKIGTMYINGAEMKAQDFNLWPDGDAKHSVIGLKWQGVPPEVYPTLAFGFIQSRQGTLWATEPWGGYQYPTSNHFGGWLDDIRIFFKPLTAQEVNLMYASEKP
jgi:hypothetical protein